MGGGGFFEVSVEHGGEPGAEDDHFQIALLNTDENEFYFNSGFLRGGNIKSHGHG